MIFETIDPKDYPVYVLLNPDNEYVILERTWMFTGLNNMKSVFSKCLKRRVVDADFNDRLWLDWQQTATYEYILKNEQNDYMFLTLQGHIEVVREWSAVTKHYGQYLRVAALSGVSHYVLGTLDSVNGNMLTREVTMKMYEECRNHDPIIDNWVNLDAYRLFGEEDVFDGMAYERL
jgi:hypothetical protein